MKLIDTQSMIQRNREEANEIQKKATLQQETLQTLQVSLLRGCESRRH